MNRDQTPERQALSDMAEELAGLGYWRLDASTQALTWSPNMFRIHGFEPGDAPPIEAAMERVHPDDRAASDARLAAFLRGEDSDIRTRIVHPDGTVRHTEGRGTCVRGPGGEVVSIFGVLMDVTARVEAEKAIAQKDAHLRLIADHGSDLIVEIDASQTIRYVSPSIRRFGNTQENVVGRPARDLIHPDDVDRIAAAAFARISGQPLDPNTDHSYRVMNAEGQAIWVEGNPTIVHDETGRPTGLITVLRDITAQRAAMAAVAESERRYRLITDHTQDMIAVCGLDGAMTFVSPSSRNVLGFEPEEMVGKAAFDCIHPDDRRAIIRTVRAYLAAGPNAPSPQMEYRAIHKDGRVIWLEAHPRAVFDEEGRLVEVQDNTRDITARKEAEAALAQSEGRYRLLADNATDVIACYDAGGRFTFLSSAIEAIMGYAPDELLGRTPMEIMHPDDIAPVTAVFRAFARRAAASTGADPIRFEYRAFRKDGQIVWLEAHPKPIHDAAGQLVEFQDVVRDISERKRTEDALTESEHRYRLLAENVTDIVSRTSIDGRFVYLSPSIRHVTGFGPAELVGSPATANMHPDDVDAALAYYRSAIRGTRPEGQSLTYRARHKSGDWIWLECRPSVVRDAEGRPTEFVDVTRDVSARHHLEEELRRARDAAEAAAAVKSDFMANMSHEIRTPLTAVIGFSSLISARTDLDPTAREHADRISTAGRALLALVNDVLDFSKLEAGRVEIAPKPINPEIIARDALDLFSLQAESKGLRLAFDPGLVLPPCVSLDPKAVGQVLLNLLGNAVKFSQAGQVALSLAYDPEAQVLRAAIRDTGPGLSAEQAERLFKRFSQVDASSTRRHGGTGLGLAICKGLVEAMGGEIGVDSVVGEGSTFHFAIPAPLATEPGDEIESGAVLRDLDGLRLLVVDDNPINRELVRAILQPLGVEVTEAVDGVSGLEVATGLPFDIILLDVRMPGLDGPEVLARLRAEDGPNQNAPILAFSAEFDAEAAAGFDAFVTKPLDPAALIGAIAHWTAFDDSQEDLDALAL